MTYIKGVDCSFDELTVAEAQRLRTKGVKVFGQCLWTAIAQPPPRVINLRVADQQGMDTWGYISLNSSPNSGAAHVDRGMRGLPVDLLNKMLFVAIDVELPNINIDDIVAACLQVRNNYRKRVVIYTNRNTWTNFVIPRNPARIADMGIGLLNAHWDGDPDIDFPYNRYGGWKDEQVIGEQYQGGGYVEGQLVDLDIFYSNRIYPATPPPPQPPPDPEKEFNDMWNKTLTNLNGAPMQFRVWQKDQTTGSFTVSEPKPLTVGQFIYLQAAGLLFDRADFQLAQQVDDIDKELEELKVKVGSDSTNTERITALKEAFDEFKSNVNAAFDAAIEALGDGTD